MSVIGGDADLDNLVARHGRYATEAVLAWVESLPDPSFRLVERILDPGDEAVHALKRSLLESPQEN